LSAIPDEAQRYRRLVELNAAEQAYALQRNPIVQGAWARGQVLAVHATVYDLADGVLRDLSASCCAHGMIPDAHASAWLEAFEARAWSAAPSAR
jgi:carbonic anhydrase